MKIDKPVVVHNHVFPRVWVPGTPLYQPPRDKEDDKLLGRLMSYVKQSYLWSDEPSLFFDRVEELKGRSARQFERKPGPFWWRLLALVYVPLNYAIIACSVVLLIEGFVLLWPAALTFIADPSPQPWFHDYFVHYAGIFLVWTFRFALAFGFVFAVDMAWYPLSASARGFAFVTEDSTAIIVFCGSKSLDHFAINAVVWPWIWPRRHAGFVRAWRHIQKDVEDWLTKELPGGGDIILTGHSLGGGIAQIAAYELRLPKACQIKHVVCFGAPRVGGAGMRELYQESDKPRLRWITRHIAVEGDSISRLPPPPFYQHLGCEYTLFEDATLAAGADASFLMSYLEVVQDVRRIWQGGPSSLGNFSLEPVSQKNIADGALAKWFAEKFSFLKWVPIQQPSSYIVAGLFLLTGACLYCARAFGKGFDAHRNELYLWLVESLAGTRRIAPELPPSKPGPVPVITAGLMASELGPAPWPGAAWSTYAPTLGPSKLGLTPAPWPGAAGSMSSPILGPSKLGLAPAYWPGPAQLGLPLVPPPSKPGPAPAPLLPGGMAAMPQHGKLRPLPLPFATLIDFNDGESIFRASKRDLFLGWRLGLANPTQPEGFHMLGKAPFFNTGHVLAAWTMMLGPEIILERFKGDDYWSWSYTYSGSKNEAIEEIKQLLLQPLDDTASREKDIPAPAAPPVKPTSGSPAAG